MQTEDLGLNLEQSPHKDRLVRYELAEAEKRRSFDHMIAGWRDELHAYLQQMGYGDPKKIHAVIDAMDEVLRRSK